MLTSDVAERKVKRTTFSCTVCGGPGYLAGDDPAREGFKLDPRDAARRRSVRRSRPQPVPEPLGPRHRPVFT